MKFEIIGTFPTLNEVIEMSKKHWSHYSKFKAQFHKLAYYQLPNNYKVEKYPVRVCFTWHLKHRRKDLDNVVAVGKKIINDALVERGIIKNDNLTCIVGFQDDVVIDKNQQERVIVEIISL